MEDTLRNIDGVFAAYAEEIRGMGSEAREAEITEVLKDVRERHATITPSPFAPLDLVTFDVKRVRMHLWGRTLDLDETPLLIDSGRRDNGDFDSEQVGTAYHFVLAEEEEQRILDAIDRGEAEIIETGTGEIHLVLAPVMLEPADGYVGKGGPLKIFDVLASLAITEAIETGDLDKADRLFSLFYSPAGTDQDPYQDNPPKLEAIRPTKHYVPNAKSTWALTDDRLFGPDGADLEVGKKSGQMTIGMKLWYDEDTPATIETSSSLDREDVRIIASVVTLKQAGNRTISPYQICEDMGIEPTPANQEETHRRVMRLRRIDGHIDWTEQARRYGIVNPETGKPFERAEITGHLIDAMVFEGTDTQGNHYIRYMLLSDPITYRHAHEIGQVLDYPQRLRKLKPVSEEGRTRRRITDDQARLIDTILRYVHILKNPKNRMGNTIGYDTLFEQTGIDTSTKDRRRTAVRFVDDYLRALQADGAIQGFIVNKANRSHRPESVTIIVEEPRRR